MQNNRVKWLLILFLVLVLGVVVWGSLRFIRGGSLGQDENMSQTSSASNKQSIDDNAQILVQLDTLKTPNNAVHPSDDDIRK